MYIIINPRKCNGKVVAQDYDHYSFAVLTCLKKGSVNSLAIHNMCHQ